MTDPSLILKKINTVKACRSCMDEF